MAEAHSTHLSATLDLISILVNINILLVVVTSGVPVIVAVFFFFFHKLLKSPPLQHLAELESGNKDAQ